MFSTDAGQQILSHNRKLSKIGKWAIPTAVANTLDKVAFEARQDAVEQFEKDHTIRSTWTQRGMRFEKVRRGSTIADMESRVGNIRPYAKVLEAGGTVKPRKKVLMSPAMAARGNKKTRRIRQASKLEVMHVFRPPNIKGGRRARFAAMLNIARKRDLPGPFLTKGDGFPNGIFMLQGRGWRNRGGGKIVMIRKIQAVAKIKGHPFVRSASNRASRNIQSIYNRNVARLIKKMR